MSHYTQKKPCICVKNPLLPTMLAHCNRCPPFWNLVFNSSTRHPGLTGILIEPQRPRSYTTLIGFLEKAMNHQVVAY